MNPLPRRTLLAGSATLAAAGAGPALPQGSAGKIVAAHNGLATLDRGYQVLRAGGDTLEAAIAVVTGPEDDPNDHSVGLGGLPNEDGVVELDACCMHGPTRRAGAVGAVRNIRNVSKLARAVMLHTGHVMLVGEGAERFAVAMGFARENLLTDDARKIWLLWKEYHSTADWWGPGLSAPDWKGAAAQQHGALPPDRFGRLVDLAEAVGIAPEQRAAAARMVLFPPTGTIHCSVLAANGEMSGITTTSGLAYKLAGRCGDSCIIGAGCYTDPEVGSAGATGSGEENIRVVGAHAIIDNMRRGMASREAGMAVLRRIVSNYGGDMSRLRYVDMTYYILRRDGVHAGVSLWQGYSPDEPHRIVVHDGSGPRAEATESLLQGYSQDYPPFAGPPAASKPIP